RNVMRAMGARQIANGLAVVLQPQRPLPLWARVLGDVVDLALLGLAARSSSSRMRLAGAAAAVAGVAALDVLVAQRTQRAFAEANKPVIYSVTINMPVMVVYAIYRALENLPRFMHYLESVEQRTITTSHWVAKLPIGGTVEWDAEIVEDVPGRMIEWRTVEGSKIKLAGRVLFTSAPKPGMTEVRVELQLGFTGMHPSTALAKLLTKPQIKGDLRRFKQIMETGEVLVSDASLHAAPHPARPAGEVDQLDDAEPTAHQSGAASTIGEIEIEIVDVIVIDELKAVTP
ncbi:MAG: SRPBCC family protein, partial [Deltaproteobacteria bacterium]|nr:SRPBCC family protein [Deltaproteobacteria bacterium]